MKKYVWLVCLSASFLFVRAQAPALMSYQAVVWDASGNLVIDKMVGVRMSIVEGSPTGATVYSEIHRVPTNANGLLSLLIGGGYNAVGKLSDIRWGEHPFFLQTETDPTGGSRYSIIGITQLVSVPYALFSGEASNLQTPSPGLPGQLLTVDTAGKPQWVSTIPTLTTSPITAITASTAAGGGQVMSDGGSAVTARGVVWYIHPNPTISLSSKTSDGTGRGSFSSALSGLLPNRTYYARAYATNSAGTGYGEEQVFTTLDSIPPVDTAYDCGAYIAPGVWKEFMCYNLGAANTTADPFTPSWEINGGYWQWGRKEMAAAGPSGPSEAEANGGSIAGWNTEGAPDGAWSDSVKTANDPCPVGYRVPTKAQWEGVLANNTSRNIGSSWNESSTNYSTGISLGSKLFLPAAGVRRFDTGLLYYRGFSGNYWSSSEDTYEFAKWLGFDIERYSSNYYYYRSGGESIRCIAE